MSQMRARRFELRTIVAAMAACMFIFGSLVTSGAHLALAGASAKAAHQIGAHTVICHDHAVDFDVADSSGPAKKRHGSHSGCPSCCLAAFVASAVLPMRFATPARPERATGAVVYFALAANLFEASVTGSANGARAPPSIQA